MSSSFVIDYSIHMKACQTFFQQVQQKMTYTQSSAAAPHNPIQDSVQIIYQAATNTLNKRGPVNSESTPSSPISSSSRSDCSDETSVESETCEGYASREYESGSVRCMLEDLILVTTLACSSASSSPHRLVDLANRPISVKSVLISLAPYWGIASLIIDMQSSEGAKELSPQLWQRVLHLLSKQFIYDAATSIQGDICSFLENSAIATAEPAVASLYERVKCVLRGGLMNPLIFGVTLSLAAHKELSLTIGTSAFTTQACVLVKSLARAALRDSISADGNNGWTPISIVCAYKSPVRALRSDADIALCMARALCQVCPSALTIADMRGKYPLHHAVQRGESSVVSLIATTYAYTVPLRDGTLRYPINYALESPNSHPDSVLLELARIYPTALSDPRTRSQVGVFLSHQKVPSVVSEGLAALSARQLMIHEQQQQQAVMASAARMKQSAFASAAVDGRDPSVFSVVDSLLSLHSSSSCENSDDSSVGSADKQQQSQLMKKASSSSKRKAVQDCDDESLSEAKMVRTH